MLIQLASVVGGKVDKKTAAQLLDDAHSLVAARTENLEQLNLQVQMAIGYGTIDPGRSFEIIDPVVDQVNALISAAALMDGFQPAQSRSFRDGELVTAGNRSYMYQYVTMVTALAAIDFDRTVTAVNRFQRSEIKTLAKMAIAQSVLTPNKSTPSGTLTLQASN